MYRSYTQNFRIFGAIMNFLQIPKVSALLKNLKISKHHCSLSLSLTARPRCQRHRTRHTAALPSPVGQNAPAVMLRRGRPHLHDLLYPTNPSQPSERQQVHRRELHVGHGGTGTTAHNATTVTMQYRQKRSEHHAQELTTITPVYMVKVETG